MAGEEEREAEAAPGPGRSLETLQTPEVWRLLIVGGELKFNSTKRLRDLIGAIKGRKIFENQITDKNLAHSGRPVEVILAESPREEAAVPPTLPPVQHPRVLPSLLFH